MLDCPHSTLGKNITKDLQGGGWVGAGETNQPLPRLTRREAFCILVLMRGVSQLHNPKIKIPESVKPLLKRLYCYCIPGKAAIQYPYA